MSSGKHLFLHWMWGAEISCVASNVVWWVWCVGCLSLFLVFSFVQAEQFKYFLVTALALSMNRNNKVLTLLALKAGPQGPHLGLSLERSSRGEWIITINNGS